MLKKLTLLAMAVGALIALAAPSMAGAAEWKTNGTPVGNGEGNGDKVHLTGTLSWTKGPLKFSCDATANIEVWNGPAAGRLDSLELSPDPTTAERCTVAILAFPPNTYAHISGCEVTPSTEAFPWAVSTEGTTAVIEGANFTYEFIGCEALGIPNGFKFKVEGTVTGEVAGNCIHFNEAGHIPEVKVDGTLCATSGELELN